MGANPAAIVIPAGVVADGRWSEWSLRGAFRARTSAGGRSKAVSLRAARRAAWTRVRGLGAGLVAVVVLTASSTPAWSLQPEAGVAVASALTPAEWGGKLWNAALGGDKAGFEALINGPAPAPLAEHAAKLREHLAKREADRAARIAEVRADLVKHLAEEATVSSASKGLVAAMELYDLVPDKKAFLAEADVRRLVSRAEELARQAEARADWLGASELFLRLSLMLEESPEGERFKSDSERLAHRLAMLRLYAPRRLWELQNERRLASGEKPMPAFNPAGEGWRQKLEPVVAKLAVTGLSQAAMQHVERVPMKRMLRGALRSMRTFATTRDLAEAFPGLADEQAVAKFLAVVSDEEARLEASPDADGADCDRLLKRLLDANAQSIAAMPQALMHEFGNGGMGELDEFSAIVWPDERARFDKMTRGNFVGVGVQIEFDEASNVRVVTPIENSPAQRAGLRPDDLIKRVNGVQLLGLSLDQVVEHITGQRGTTVTLSIERKEPMDGDHDVLATREFDVELKRDIIDVPSVTGWSRRSAAKQDWDWFVDRGAGIGYVRLQQFSERTTEHLWDAVNAMQREGLRGLVLDLRFNPGGLLPQAVSVSQMFIDKGVIVMTQKANKTVGTPEKGSGTAILDQVPVVVLVNRGSASASEIVAGALQYYGRQGDIPAVVVGQRSFGKGSVQEVRDMPFGAGARAALKLTTHYYLLPDARMIHRRPGAPIWGVDPNLEIEMLPKQIADSVTHRRNADVLPMQGDRPVTPADPGELLSKSLDLQLEAAVLLLRARAEAGPPQARAER